MATSPATAAAVTGSPGETSKSCAFRKRLNPTPPATPAMMPAAVGESPCLRTSAMTLPGLAPSATRTPISRRRCATRVHHHPIQRQSVPPQARRRRRPKAAAARTAASIPMPVAPPPSSAPCQRARWDRVRRLHAGAQMPATWGGRCADDHRRASHGFRPRPEHAVLRVREVHLGCGSARKLP